MSRLDSFIRRLQAQRACLDAAAEAIAGLEGPVFELGLGNGRTFDHLRARLPGRDIYVFERQVAAHPACIPDADRLFLGDIRETLPAAAERFGGRVALVHADIGTGDPASNAVIAGFVAGHLGRLLRPGGLVVSDQPMPYPDAEELALPADVQQGRYFMTRRREAPEPGD
jgi:SAM-dependent methyltransferase